MLDLIWPTAVVYSGLYFWDSELNEFAYYGFHKELKSHYMNHTKIKTLSIIKRYSYTLTITKLSIYNNKYTEFGENTSFFWHVSLPVIVRFYDLFYIYFAQRQPVVRRLLIQYFNWLQITGKKDSNLQIPGYVLFSTKKPLCHILFQSATCLLIIYSQLTRWT